MIKYSLNNESDVFGPGTDLIVSLVAVLFVVICLGFYLQKETKIIGHFYQKKYIENNDKLQKEIFLLESEIEKLEDESVEQVEIVKNLNIKNNEISLLYNELSYKYKKLYSKYNKLLFNQKKNKKQYLNTLHPKRSKKGKNIVRVKMSIIDGKKYYYISKIDSNPIFEVSRRKFHNRLKMLKRKYKGNLYVQVLHSDNLKYRDFWKFTKEVLVYDYYQLNE